MFASSAPSLQRNQILSIPEPTDRKDSYLVILPVELSTMNLLSQGDFVPSGCVVV